MGEAVPIASLRLRVTGEELLFANPVDFVKFSAFLVDTPARARVAQSKVSLSAQVVKTGYG
jgi:hypothetical protein